MRWHHLHESVGTFALVKASDGWKVFFELQDLGGPYASAQAALDALISGRCDTPSCGDPTQLGLPDEIDEWNFDPR